MLRGRLVLETARIPHADRHGLLWLSRGTLTVRDGTLRFERNSDAEDGSPPESGEYGISFQTLSMILLGPGSTVSHDALRLMARHGTALVAVGENGVRCYTAPPLMPDTSEVARKQMRAWSDPEGSRITIARKMYALRLGEVLPHRTWTPSGELKGEDETDLSDPGSAVRNQLESAPLRQDGSALGRYSEPSHQSRVRGGNLCGCDCGGCRRGNPPTGIHPRAQQ